MRRKGTRLELGGVLTHRSDAGIPDHEVLLVLFPLLVAALCGVIVVVTLLSRRGLLPPLEESVPLAGVITAIAAGLSLAAAAIHNAVIPEHFDQDPLVGLAFVAMAVLQLGWGLLYLAVPNTVVAFVGLVVSDGLIALWAWTRTFGLPMGPERNQPEPIAFIDVTATFLELLLITLLVITLAPQARRLLARPLRFGDAAIATVFGVIVIGTVTGVAITGFGAG